MGKQIYICWEEGQAEELFQYVQEECGMTILPMKKTNSTSTDADALPCVFVQEEAAGLFRYKRFRDENGEPCKVLYLFDRNKDNLPYIEYTQECSNNMVVGEDHMTLYLLDHRHWIESEYYDTKLIGILSSHSYALEVIERYSQLPGF